jgi:hypothetical protein
MLDLRVDGMPMETAGGTAMLDRRGVPAPHYTPAVNLIETLGVEIGVRQVGTPAADEAAEAVAAAFREVGLEPRFHDFSLLGYEADEPLLEIEGER